jgi:hypothetical protein
MKRIVTALITAAAISLTSAGGANADLWQDFQKLEKKIVNAAKSAWDKIRHVASEAIQWVQKKVVHPAALDEVYQTINGRRYIIGPVGVKHELNPLFKPPTAAVRALALKAPVPAPQTVAHSVDLRAGFPDIRDQWWRGTCVAFATMGAMEYAFKKNPSDLSEQYAYWMFKNAETGAARCQSGAFIFEAARLLHENGVPPAKDWHYQWLDIRELFRKDCFNKETYSDGAPPDQAKRDAKYYIKSFTLVDGANGTDPTYLMSLLQAGHPIVYGVGIAGTDWKAWKSWFTPMIDVQVDQNKKPLAAKDSHAIVLVGYDLDKKAFRIRNSWGPLWGKWGYHWLSFDYVRTYGQGGFYINEVGQK